jgi:hypothetical protein
MGNSGGHGHHHTDIGRLHALCQIERLAMDIFSRKAATDQ